MNDQERGIVKAWQQGLAAKDAEITRLRAALEVFADGSHWFVTEPVIKGYGPTDWDWMHETIENPAEFARKALEAKS